MHIPHEMRCLSIAMLQWPTQMNDYDDNNSNNNNNKMSLVQHWGNYVTSRMETSYFRR